MIVFEEPDTHGRRLDALGLHVLGRAGALAVFAGGLEDLAGFTKHDRGPVDGVGPWAGVFVLGPF